MLLMKEQMTKNRVMKWTLQGNLWDLMVEEDVLKHTLKVQFLKRIEMEFDSIKRIQGSY